MQVNFLCSGHREWVYMHSHEVSPYLESAISQGRWLYREQSYREAVPFLGTAYETIHILLELHGLSQSQLVTEMTDLAEMLSVCYQTLEHPMTADAIVEDAIIRLDVGLCIFSESSDSAPLFSECKSRLCGIRDPKSVLEDRKPENRGYH